MKKYLVSLFFIFSLIAQGFCQKKLSEPVNDSIIVQPPEELIVTESSPQIFHGIWEADDRYIMFQNKKELKSIIHDDVELLEDNYIWIYLKLFYSWYTERSAESDTRKSSPVAYDRNDAQFRDIQNIKLEFRPLVSDENCNAFEIILTYPGYKEKTVIPVAVIDDELYLDFAIKTGELPVSDENVQINPLTGSWSTNARVNGIKVSKPITKNSLTSIYITQDSVYYIRYWKTDMPYSGEKAFFSDGKIKYEVPKHIKSAGNIYTCVTGRSLTIRNVERRNLPLDDYKINKNNDVIVFGKPYMKKIFPECSVSEMMEIVKVDNSRRAPPEKPVFPPSNLDWHIDDITRLEINNQIIQAVRKRQREFYEKYQLGLHY